MDNYTIIKAFGLETRTWTYKEEYGYGCAECCNGDRCEDDCTAKYRRPNCPHCQGKGWIKKEDVQPMSNNTQLPAEVVKDIEALQLKHSSDTWTDSDYNTGYDNGIRKGIGIGATEYATKLHQLGEHYEALKISYDAALEKAIAARALLKKFISRHEGCWVVDKELYNEIKSFIDGNK